MITSSLFFKKTFFTIEQDDNDHLYQEMNRITKFNQENQKIKARHTQFRHYTRDKSKNALNIHSSLDHYQNNSKNARKYLSKINNRNLQASQINDVSPWVQKTTHKSRQLHEVQKQRQKVQNRIKSYRFGKTLEENQKYEDFKKDKYFNFLTNKSYNLERGQKRAIKQSSNLIKSIDINMQYDNYLNSQIKKNIQLYMDPNRKYKLNSKYKDLCSGCKIQQNHIFRLRQSFSNNQNIQEQMQSDSKCLNCYKNHQTFDDSNIVENPERQKSPLVRRLFKIQVRRNLLDKIGPINTCRVPKLGKAPKLGSSLRMESQVKQKLKFQISGSKTHKLDYQKL